MLTKNECAQRVANLQRGLRAQGVDGALIVQSVDLFYYSGTRQNATLWVPAEGEPVLLVKKSLVRALPGSRIEQTRQLASSQEIPALLGEGAVKIGLTFDVLPVQQFNVYTRLLPGREFCDISALNRKIRSVKSPWELERLAESSARLCEVFRQIPQLLREGMREIDLSAELEYRLRKMGHEGCLRLRAFNQELFFGLTACGVTAEQPGCFDGPVTGQGLSSAAPYGSSATVIPANSPVVVDFSGVFNGYLIDMTRIFAIDSLAPDLERAFDVSLEIQNHLVDMLKPGVACEDLYLKALAMAKEAGLERHFMGAPGENARFVGHGVGLELDEHPVLAQGFTAPLMAGQTLAIEPKFVFPGLGVVGIENVFAVTEDGGARLTDLADEIVYV